MDIASHAAVYMPLSSGALSGRRTPVVRRARNLSTVIVSSILGGFTIMRGFGHYDARAVLRRGRRAGDRGGGRITIPDGVRGVG